MFFYLFNHLQNKSYFFHIEKESYSSNIDSSIFVVIYVTWVYDIVYKILKRYMRFVLTVFPLDEK